MLKIVFKNLWAVRAPPRTLLESSQRSPDRLASRACCSLPKNPTPLLAFGLDVRPSPNSLHFPQCVFVRVLIKTLVVPIFGAKECIRMQDFVLNIQYKKNSGVTTPGPPRWEGRHLFAPTPVPTRQNAGAPPLLLGWYGPAHPHASPFHGFRPFDALYTKLHHLNKKTRYA